MDISLGLFSRVAFTLPNMRKSFTYIFRGDVIYILLAQIGKHMKLKNT